MNEVKQVSYIISLTPIVFDTNVSQKSTLFRVSTGMEHPILRLLFKYHLSVANLAATCQEAYMMVFTYIDHWDVSRREFNGCDMDPNHPSAKGNDPTFGVGKIVVVSQFRNREWKMGEHFPTELLGLQRLTMSFNHYAHRFESLHLHRIPLLTTELLSLVVPYMRKLKHLGVYRCELIHFGDTARLLDIVHTKHRGAGQTQHIHLDFYPRFHDGPVEANCDPQYYGGSYGITWDNAKMDTRLGMAKILMDVLPKAKEQGINLVSKDAAFRLFLEKSPLWRVQELVSIIDGTCEALPEPRNLALNVSVATVAAWPYTKGKLSRLNRLGDWYVFHYSFPLVTSLDPLTRISLDT